MFYDTDIEDIVRLISREFAVDEGNSVDQRRPASADSFGYRSFHLVFTLDARRDTLPEWAPFAGIPVELQVRTVLAHAWAAVGHQLAYKRPALPVEQQRLLAQISAMLEASDALFDTLRSTQTRNAEMIEEFGIATSEPASETGSGDEEPTS